MKSCENNIKGYINNLKRINNQLRAKDIKLPNKVIYAWILNNLSDNYDLIVTTITQIIRVNKNKSINLIELFVNLVDESKRIIIRDKESVLYIHDNKIKLNKLNKHRVEKSKNNKKCFYCKKSNYTEIKC